MVAVDGFGERVEEHRRELHVHCYRMLGSFDEAEDLVQETFLRAWRRRDTLRSEAGLRAWLYRIATNACLDHLGRTPGSHSRARRRPRPIPGSTHRPRARFRGSSRTPTRCWTRPTW